MAFFVLLWRRLVGFLLCEKYPKNSEIDWLDWKSFPHSLARNKIGDNQEHSSKHQQILHKNCIICIFIFLFVLLCSPSSRDGPFFGAIDLLYISSWVDHLFKTIYLRSDTVSSFRGRLFTAKMLTYIIHADSV